MNEPWWKKLLSSNVPGMVLALVDAAILEFWPTWAQQHSGLLAKFNEVVLAILVLYFGVPVVARLYLRLRKG